MSNIIRMPDLPEAATPHLLPEHTSVPIPSPWEGTEQYEVVAAQIGLELPASTNLGLALAQLDPRQQHTLRGLYGMYPFTEPLDYGDLADRYDTKRRLVRERATLARTLLGKVALSEATPSKALRACMPLEDLARLLERYSDCLSEGQAETLRAVTGLPPFKAPVRADDIAKLFDISRSTAGKRETLAIKKLLHARDTALSEIAEAIAQAPDSVINVPEDLQRQLRLKDAGRHAEILFSLRDPITRPAWATIIKNDLRNSSKERAAVYKRAQVNPWPIARLRDDPIEPDERHDRLNERRAKHILIDTDEGQDALIQALITQANDLTSEDAALLPEIIADGRQATQAIIEQHLMLAFFGAMRTIRPKGRQHVAGLIPLAQEVLTAAYEGLAHAVKCYDEKLGFTFSAYTVKNVGGYVLSALRSYAVAKTTLSHAAFVRIKAINKATEALSQELHRPPSDEEIAARLNMRLASVKNYKALRQTTKAVSLSTPIHTHSSRAGDETSLTVEDTVHHIATTHIEQDEDTSKALREALVKMYDSVGLSQAEQTVLNSMFGLNDDGIAYSDGELAKEIGLTLGEVKQLFASAKKKMISSPEASRILLGYIKS